MHSHDDNKALTLSVNKRHAMHAEEMAFFYELAANEQILSCPTVR